MPAALIAHVAGVPVEELLAVILGSGTAGAWLALRARASVRLRRLRRRADEDLVDVDVPGL